MKLKQSFQQTVYGNIDKLKNEKYALNIIYFHITSPNNVETRDKRTTAQYFSGSD